MSLGTRSTKHFYRDTIPTLQSRKTVSKYSTVHDIWKDSAQFISFLDSASHMSPLRDKDMGVIMMEYRVKQKPKMLIT